MKSDSVRIPIPICFIQHDTTENELAVEDGMEETKKLVEKAEKRVDKGMEVSYTNQAASRGAAARTEKT